MLRRHSIILSFVLATLLAAGGVELFYSSLSQALRGDKEAVQTKTEKTVPTGTSMTANADTPVRIPFKRTTVRENKEDYTIISKRNLFGKIEENNIEKAPEPEPVLTATSLKLVLLGTIGGTASDQRAFIRNKKDNTQDIYYKGDAIEHALIKEISRGQIILTVNGKDEVLLMEESKSPKGSGKSNGNTSEVYSLADAMEKEKQAKLPSRPKRTIRKDKTLQLEKQLR
jgi:type II secretory pathway component PulC